MHASVLLGWTQLVTQGCTRQLSTPKVLELGQQGLLFALSRAIHTRVPPGRSLCKGPPLTRTFCVGQKDASSQIRRLSQWPRLLLGLPTHSGGSRRGDTARSCPASLAVAHSSASCSPRHPELHRNAKALAARGLPFPQPHTTSSSAGFCFKGREYLNS